MACLSSMALAQSNKLKRKNRGVYVGTIPAYEAIIGNQPIQVKPCELKIYLDRDSLFMELGTYRYAAVYQFEKKETQFEIRLERSQSGIEEVLYLDPKNRTLLRKGLFPQPDVLLQRSQKLPRR
ncbi:MAG: hypothetical protein RLZZ301_1758 [Bacteroidota bacterium]|jgi:hypothetical protein